MRRPVFRERLARHLGEDLCERVCSGNVLAFFERMSC